MKIKAFTSLWFFILSLILGGCISVNQKQSSTPVLNQAPATSTPGAHNETTAESQMTERPKIELVDGLGRIVSLDKPATRIVTLGASALESLFAIGAGDVIVGREEYSTYPPEALEITSVGSLWGELPAEAILTLEPDLVIAPEIISQEQVTVLQDLGLMVFWQKNPVDFEGLFTNLKDLAVLTGHETDAELLIQNLTDRVSFVLSKTKDVKSRPVVYYELDATDPSNPYTIGAGTFISTIIQLAGGENLGEILSGDYAQISSEEVIHQNPEIVLLADAPYGVSKESLLERPGWGEIKAVKNNQVYPFDPYLVSVPGPRLVEGLETMAAIFHPELFPK